MAKINLKRGLTDVVLYLIIFIVVQIIMMYAGAGIWAGIKGEGYQVTLQAASTGGNAILTALVSVFSSVITLIIFQKTKWTPLTRSYLLSKPWARFSGWHCSPWEPSSPCRSSMNSWASRWMRIPSRYSPR